ncbi:glycosyltransferase family 4 protein [bacterium]|nr:glycosyltransferase family 4 protein [bacterium]
MTQKAALIVTDVTAPGGVDTYIVALHDAAYRDGWDVHVLMDKGEGSDRLFRTLHRRGARITRAGLYHRTHDETARAAATDAVLHDIAPTVVHAVCPAPWNTVVPRERALEAGARLIFTEQYVAEGFTFEPSLKERIDELYRRADRAIAVSKNNQRLLADMYGFPSDKLVLIPNAVPTEGPPAKSVMEKARVLADLGLPERPHQAVCVARLDDQKGIDVLVQAAARLPVELRRGLCISVFGDGPNREALFQMGMRAGVGDVMYYWGWRENAAEMIDAFDLFILPSRSEGQPFALLEALARGIPTIATRVSGIPEVLMDGQGGDLVPPDDPAALAIAIEAYLRDPSILTQKSRVGRAHVRTYHDLTTNMATTMKLWRGGVVGTD